MTKGERIRKASKENSTQLLVGIYLWKAFYKHVISAKRQKSHSSYPPKEVLESETIQNLAQCLVRSMCPRNIGQIYINKYERW